MFYGEKKPCIVFPLKKQLFLRERFQGKVTRDKFIQCIINKQTSAAKMLIPKVQEILQDVTNEINFIKTNL